MARIRKDQEDEPVVRIVFGGGISSRQLEQDIRDRECSDGQNFHLDLESASFARRRPFDAVAAAPNAGAIMGWAQLETSDGTLTQLIQAGSNVYAWDGTASGFTLVGTCPASAQLRGKLESNFLPLGYGIITDLNMLQPVSKWDGTTFSIMPTNLGTTFFAKYCNVELERAFFANVAAGTPTPHMLVGSATTDPTTLSITDQPSSSLGPGDPFYVLTPNLSPINGFPVAPRTKVLSTKIGDIYAFGGSSANDFALTGLFPRAGVAGDEAITYIENDIAYGRIGRIESLYGVQTYGQVEAAELSRWIGNEIEEVASWTLVYDRRLFRLYCFPTGVQEVWVLHKSLLDGQAQHQGAFQYGTSPWSKWVTAHALSFLPTCVWTMKRPSDGLFMVYMGDASGNVYQLDGAGAQDGGSADLTVERVSKLYGLPDGEMYDITGFVRYRQLFPFTVTLQFEFCGAECFDQPITLSLTTSGGSSVYGGSGSTAAYFGGTLGGQTTAYFGQRFARRLTRHPFDVAGKSSDFRVRATVDGAADFAIDEIVVNIVTRKS